MHLYIKHHVLSEACYQDDICLSVHKVQLRLMGVFVVVQIYQGLKFG